MRFKTVNDSKGMATAQSADGVFVATDRPILMRLGLLVGSVSFAIPAWQRYTHIHHVDPGIVGLVLVSSVAFVAMLGLPTTRFTFDPARKLITWRAGSLTNFDGGELAFSQVSDVVLQISAADATICYRVALRSGDRTIPLAVEYSGDRPAVEQVAQKIRTMLGMSPDAPIVDTTRSSS